MKRTYALLLALLGVMSSAVADEPRRFTEEQLTFFGSPSEWTADELREHAHKAIAPQLKADYSEFRERFGTAVANSKASDDLDEVLKAAKAGRVNSLIVCQNDDHCEQTNQAVLETLRNGGDVMQGSPESMPSGAAVVAAIFGF